MGKVFRYEELNRKEYHIYSESYIVNYWILEGEFWKKTYMRYFGKTKSDHKSVYDKWKSDNINNEVTFISISYE